MRAVPGRDYLAIFFGGLCAGILSAVAGGGTLVCFPMLLRAGRDPIIANGAIRWDDGLVLGVGSVAGGLLGAAVGRRLSSRALESVAIVEGVVATAALILRRH